MASNVWQSLGTAVSNLFALCLFLGGASGSEASGVAFGEVFGEAAGALAAWALALAFGVAFGEAAGQVLGVFCAGAIQDTKAWATIAAKP